MQNIFNGVATLIYQCFTWVQSVINGIWSGAWYWIIGAFTIYTITRYIINPALKGRLAGSDSVRKKDD